MQLYSVKFRHHKADSIDIGEMLVVANSKETAEDTVVAHLGLTRSATSCEVTRLKPSIYQVMRGEVPKEKPVNGTFPTSQAQLDRFMEGDREPYAVQITAVAWAHSGDNAVKKVAKAAIVEAEGQAVTAKAVKDLKVFSDRQEIKPRQSTVERNAMFTHMRMFQGGAARPR